MGRKLCPSQLARGDLPFAQPVAPSEEPFAVIQWRHLLITENG